MKYYLSSKIYYLSYKILVIVYFLNASNAVGGDDLSSRLRTETHELGRELLEVQIQFNNSNL